MADYQFAMHRGMKQVELAEALGVNEMTILNWEKGRTKPSGELLRRIEGFFGRNMPCEGGIGC